MHPHVFSRCADCPDPGTCGFVPIPCIGCVPGVSRTECPHAEWCAQNMTTPPCMDCMAGMAMPYCPNATQCMGPGPSPPPPPTPPVTEHCTGCIDGQPTPSQQHSDVSRQSLCRGSRGRRSCRARSGPCLFVPCAGCPKPQQCGYTPILCVDCMDGMSMPQCLNATWCVGVDCSKAKSDCMDGMPMPSQSCAHSLVAIAHP
jgi:hypothetical protein